MMMMMMMMMMMTIIRLTTQPARTDMVCERMSDYNPSLLTLWRILRCSVPAAGLWHSASGLMYPRAVCLLNRITHFADLALV
jgi:hypothetical protein